MHAAAALALIASGCSTVPAEPTVRVEYVHPVLPAQALRPCARPVEIPDRPLSEEDATRYWLTDRQALKICETKRALAVEAVGKAP